MKYKLTWMRGMGSPNRVGSNLWRYTGILIRAYNRKILCRKIFCKYRDTLLCSVLNKYIDLYNKTICNVIDYKNVENIELGEKDPMQLLTLPLVTTCEIKQDLYSYFKQHLHKDMTVSLKKEIDKKKFIIPDNWKKRICIHVRLDDCAQGQHSIDYDGRTGHNFFSEKINHNDNKWNWNGDYEEYFKKKKIRMIGRGKSAYQSPIPYDRINNLIDTLKKKYPTHEIVIVASPLGNVTIPLKYKHIRSENPDLDLFYQIYCDILVCSRSTYSMVAAFFHQGSQVIIPKWVYSGACGLESNCDKSDFKFYY